MRILAIDDTASAAYLRRGLGAQGHVVDIATDGTEGLHLANSGPYDLILLDVLLPGVDDGWHVLRGIREQQQTPLFVLSGCTDVNDRIRAIKGGADDFLTKPFAFGELLARIDSLLRRSAGISLTDPIMRVADLEVDPVRRYVNRSRSRIDLTAKEFVLLDYLVRHAGEVVSRTLIAENVWDMHFDSDTNVVDVAVRRLRAKVDRPFHRKLIHTIRGVGYVLDTRT